MMSFPIWRFGQNHFRHYTNFISNRSLSMSAGVVQKMDYSVIHDEKNKEFYINVGQEKAVLQYQLLDGEQNIMDFYHTGVPESQRGKGIAGQLVRAAFSFVVAKNFIVRPTCSYVQHYIDKNKPEEIIQRLE